VSLPLTASSDSPFLLFRICTSRLPRRIPIYIQGVLIQQAQGVEGIQIIVSRAIRSSLNLSPSNMKKEANASVNAE